MSHRDGKSKLCRILVFLTLAFSSSMLAAFADEQISGLPSKESMVPSNVVEQTKNEKDNAQRFSGNVSWYGVPFHGRKTASGRIFDMNKLTAAHRTLPFGTKVLVEDPNTGKTVIVEVIDRGPYAAHRVMDLSREAARRLGTLLGGVRRVDCMVLKIPSDSD